MAAMPAPMHPRFPRQRLRRLRRTAGLRGAVADVVVRREDLIQPVFVGEMARPVEVASMPGVRQWPVAAAVEQVKRWRDLGLTQFLLFGVTPGEKKDATGSYAASPDAPVNRLIAAVRDAGLDVVLHADLCLCEYTEHGHCGVVADGGRGERVPGFGFRGPQSKLEGASAATPASDETRSPEPATRSLSPTVSNDPTLALYAHAAIAQAAAGADTVAPSGMMDGQVGAIRDALDAAGHGDTAIMAYSVKYASGFYGPFRDAGEGGMKCGDRKGYQMDYRRRREWALELAADLEQGADLVIVKPAATYLDIVQQVRAACDVPVVGYHVSGEYAMLHAAAERGWVDLQAAALETTFAIKRAGADLVITYFAERLAEWL